MNYKDTINIINQKNCCGCGCCAEICPKKVIEMGTDEKGFFRPHLISEKGCISCGQCTEVCPMNSKMPENPYKQKFIALSHTNENVRALSASGGAFSALAEALISEGGSVYGAVFNSDFDVMHVGGDGIGALDALRGSKYVQSMFWICIQELIEKVKLKKRILVVGTPCQIHGLRNVLQGMGIDDDVYLVDLICHGVPSQKLFKDHINYLGNKYGKIIRYRSRSKIEGWHTYFDRIFTEEGELNSYKKIAQHWRRIFASNLCLQDECYRCKYASFSRCSDITIGDFWGIEKHYPKLDDNKGKSLVIINSDKGQDLFEKISKNTNWFSISKSEATQNHLYKPCQKPNNTELFWKEYFKQGWAYVAKKYANTTFKMNIIRLFFRVKFMKNNRGYREYFGEIWRK